MAQDQAGATRSVAMPTELNPFLVQIVAVGVGADLSAARGVAHASLRKRASQIRTQFKFPIIFGMSYALTGRHIRACGETQLFQIVSARSGGRSG